MRIYLAHAFFYERLYAISIEINSLRTLEYGSEFSGSLATQLSVLLKALCMGDLDEFTKQRKILRSNLINQENYVSLAQLLHFLDRFQGGLKENLGDSHLLISDCVVKLTPHGQLTLHLLWMLDILSWSLETFHLY